MIKLNNRKKSLKIKLELEEVLVQEKARHQEEVSKAKNLDQV